MKPKVFILCLLFAVFCLFSLSYAEVPQMINYQGKLTNLQGALIDTTISITFTIYTDSIAGSALWSETQGSVKVEKGVFSILIGAVNSLPDTVFAGGLRYLGVKIGSDPEMKPRRVISSVANAFQAKTIEKPCLSDFDWCWSGTNILYLCRSDANVGIGTTDPTAKLDVRGSFLAGESNADGLGLMIVGSRITPTNIPGGVDCFVGDLYLDGMGGGAVILAESGGRVGIGTTDPGKKLEIAGDVFINSEAGDPSYYLRKGDSQVADEYWGVGLTGVGDDHKLSIFQDDNGSYPWSNEWLVIKANSGDVGIGTENPQTKLDVIGNIWQHGFGSGDGQAPNHILHFARGSLNSPTIVSNGDDLAWIAGSGYDGTDFQASAGILMEVDGSPGTNDMPGRITFQTATQGTGQLEGKMVIKNDGNVGIGTDDPQQRLHIGHVSNNKALRCDNEVIGSEYGFSFVSRGKYDGKWMYETQHYIPISIYGTTYYIRLYSPGP